MSEPKRYRLGSGCLIAAHENPKFWGNDTLYVPAKDYDEMRVYAEDLARVAELSENIARRLHKRGWNAEEKTQHAADLAERDRILVAVRPSYAECIQFREEQ